MTSAVATLQFAMAMPVAGFGMAGGPAARRVPA